MDAYRRHGTAIPFSEAQEFVGGEFVKIVRKVGSTPTLDVEIQKCNADERPVGITKRFMAKREIHYFWDSDRTIFVSVLLGGTVVAGDKITTGANGRGVKAIEGGASYGIVLRDGVSGDYAMVYMNYEAAATGSGGGGGADIRILFSDGTSTPLLVYDADDNPFLQLPLPADGEIYQYVEFDGWGGIGPTPITDIANTTYSSEFSGHYVEDGENKSSWYRGGGIAWSVGSQALDDENEYPVGICMDNWRSYYAIVCYNPTTYQISLKNGSRAATATYNPLLADILVIGHVVTE